MMHPGQPRSLLPHFLAVFYGLSIVYASLQPFAPWIAPAPGTPFFLWAPWPTYGTRFDVIANVVAYIPLGFFVALVPRRRRPTGRLSLAIAVGATLSFAIESLQMFVPSRDASIVDLISNTSGATLGGALAIAFARSAAARQSVASLRERWFLPGRIGDLGLALLVIWLAVQVNPGIPLFATMFEATPTPEVLAGTEVAPNGDLVAALVEGAHSGFQLLGVGLFLALLVRNRRFAGGAILLLIGIALVVKGVAATVLLKPTVWSHWLSPGVSTGVAVGALVLLAAIWLPRPVQVAVATVALLSSLLTTLLAPDLLFARPPLSQFSWSYGHLLNFNGLTHMVLLAWPVVASAYLFALAGRPRWGEPT